MSLARVSGRSATGAAVQRLTRGTAHSTGAAPFHLLVDSPTCGAPSNFFKRTIRALRLAATNERIPKSLRWLVALGLLPVPGPFDEAVLLIAAVPLALFYRAPFAEAWKRAGDPNFAKPS